MYISTKVLKPFLIAFIFSVTGCSDPKNWQLNEHSNNQTTPSDETTENQQNQDDVSVESFLQQRPMKSVMLSTEYSLVEDFTEIESEDSPLTLELLEQVSVKQHMNSKLAITALGGIEPKYRESTSSVYYNVSLDFKLTHLFCPEYKLGITYRRGDWWGNRYYKLMRAEDNFIIEPEQDATDIDSAATIWYSISRLDGPSETIKFVGSKIELFKVEVVAKCDLLDSDNDGLVDARELVLGTDINNQDSDNDGLLDGEESNWGLNPLSSVDGANQDADLDGMSNAEEIARGIGPQGYAPTASDVTISSVPEIGQALQVSYYYNDRDFSPESTSQITWLVNGVEYNQDRYTPTSADLGQLIQVCVTPLAEVGLPRVGVKVCTDEYPIQESPESWSGLGPVTLSGRHDGKGVDLVVLGDGFSAEEMDKFKQTALNFKKTFLGFNEIALHDSAWNIHAVGVISNESGLTDHSVDPIVEKDTYFESCKGCGSLTRIVAANGTIAKNVAAQNFPQYDAIIVLVNSTRYGGVGGGVATSTATPTSAGVSIHEIAHSFGQLADEYGGTSKPRTTEPVNANVTINNDPDTVKWKHWINATRHLSESAGKVGLFEGGNYRKEGVWRPTLNSQMNGGGSQPFHSVNAEAWALRVYSTAGAISSIRPNNSTPYYHDKNTLATYAISSVFTESTQRIDWYLDGVLINSGSKRTFQIPTKKVGSYEVLAVITDVSGGILKDTEKVANTEIQWLAEAQ
ncbi:M64 family metallopeptidase [Reinekea marina]|uniref:M64 family metallopeptidase n=1 Tax=Reinekea marina TaxID=1310421 RepID=A0ABV7WMZ3_9GAMM|nr:M64 family metallopeptidase [Reinekea marina]MDN3648648.1 M64 family metallopeptidase [Reinekea marina]